MQYERIERGLNYTDVYLVSVTNKRSHCFFGCPIRWPFVLPISLIIDSFEAFTSTRTNIWTSSTATLVNNTKSALLNLLAVPSTMDENIIDLTNETLNESVRWIFWLWVNGDMTMYSVQCFWFVCLNFIRLSCQSNNVKCRRERKSIWKNNNLSCRYVRKYDQTHRKTTLSRKIV